MPQVLPFLLAVAAATGLLPTHPVPVIRSDDTVAVPHGDVHMANAIREARSRLQDFLARARKPDPATHTFAVKLAVPTDVSLEFIWITPFEMKDGHFVGQISNEPRNIKGIRRGQWVQFDEDGIVDWTFHQNGKRKGNFTARAIAKRLPPAEAEKFMKDYDLDREP